MDEFFAQNRLSAFIDGELPESEMAEVSKAIDESPELRRTYEEMHRTVQYLRAHGSVEAPASLHLQVMQAVEDLPVPRPWRSLPRRLLARLPREGLALAAVAVTILVLVWQTPRPANGPGGDEASAQEKQAVAAGPAAEKGAADKDTGNAQASKGTATIGVGVLPQGTPLPDGASLAGKEQAQDQLLQKEHPRPIKGQPVGNNAPLSAYLPPPAGSGGSGGLNPGTRHLPSVTSVPGEPYVPDWDKEPADEAQARATLATPPPGEPPTESAPGPTITYRLHGVPSDGLRVIVSLTERLGGHAYTPAGQPFSAFTLTNERNHATLILQLPSGQLDALDPQLRHVGALSEVRRPPELMVSESKVEVEVEVFYAP
jgi:anti-sigma factor RsiW